MNVTLEHVARWVLPNVEHGHALAPNERRTLETMAGVLLEGCPVSIPHADVVANVERFLLAGGSRSRRAWRCRLLLALVEAAPFGMFGRPLEKLTPGETRKYAQALVRGRHVYGACARVRQLVLLGVYSDPRAAAATGYVPTLERARIARALHGRRLPVAA